MAKERARFVGALSRREFGALTGVMAVAWAAIGTSSLVHATDVGRPYHLGGGVAANPQDRAVLGWTSGGRGSHLLVVTDRGEVFAHRVTLEDGVEAPYRLEGSLGVRAAQVRWFLGGGGSGGILVVRTSGDASYHRIGASSDGTPVRVEAGEAVETPTPVGVNPEDTHALLMGDRLTVFRNDGRVGFHTTALSADPPAIGPGALMRGSSVASLPQDRWVIRLCADEIGVITATGEVFSHLIDRTSNEVLAPTRVRASTPVAANAADRWVTQLANFLVVITDAGEVWAHPKTCMRS